MRTRAKPQTTSVTKKRRPVKMASASRLVEGFMEHVSWRAMADYREVIKSLIRKKPGIYALYRGDKLYYVGLAANLMGRVNTHLKNRHKGKWDHFSVYLTSVGDVTKPLESLLLRIAKPAGNAISGRLSGSTNLERTLNQRMSSSDADRRARLLGGKAVARRIRSRSGAGRGTLHLAGLVDRRLSLKATYKGVQHKASLRRDGRISYKGALYDSPSAAGRAVVGRGIQGWSFWYYRRGKDGWVKLKELRR